MIIIRAQGNQVAFPKHTPWAVFTCNEHYVDENGNLAPDISSGFGPYMDLCIYAGDLFVFKKVYAGYEVADRLQRCIIAGLCQPVIIADLLELCEDAMGFRQKGDFEVIPSGKVERWRM